MAAVITMLFASNLVLPPALRGQFLNPDEPVGGIRLNQIGYAPTGTKIAVLDSYLFPGQHSVPFYIIALNQYADTVFKGRLRPTPADLYAGKMNYLADFSSLTTAGHYFISIPGQGSSYPFIIQNQPFEQVLKAAIKSYYYNRASMDLRPEFAGRWARLAGHPDTSVIVHHAAATPSRPKGSHISAPGGWYDAGDYNKYIVNAAITVETILEAFEDYPTLLTDMQLTIPQPGNGLPDIINEVLYNIRWMLKMQDPADGGVYHKLTSAHFDGMEMPHKDHDKRYVTQKSTAATLDFAAVTAGAARALKRFNHQLPELQDSLLTAAVKAWNWAKAHPAIIYNQDAMNKKYRPKITTGAYGDKSLKDEWYQAAVSLLLATKDKQYLPQMAVETPISLKIPSWQNTAAIGTIWLSKLKPEAFKRQKSWTDEDYRQLVALQQKAKTALLQLSDQLIKHINPGYNTVMGGRSTDFMWGSNSEAANQGWILMTAYLMTANTKYRAAALGNLDYLLGRNATGYCFVTGFGSLSPLHPHHRISIADGVEAPIPGMLVGGPNPGQQDGVKAYPSKRPDLSYLDNDAAYSTNEIAINWNAPLVYLLAAITSTEKKEIH